MRTIVNPRRVERPGVGRTVGVATALALGTASPVAGQTLGRAHAGSATWAADVSAGALAEPNRDGSSGLAGMVVVSRRLPGARMRLSALAAIARASDVGPAGANRFVFDRDWRLAAVGPDWTALSAGRVDLTAGVQAGALWARTRRVGTIGTPVPAGFLDPTAGKATWDANAALVPRVGVSYRLAGPVAVSGTGMVVQRLFGDDVLGPTGALGSLGLRLLW